MISLIIGKKGSGKTKKLIDNVNAAAETTKGNVVCVEKGNTLTFNVKSAARLVDSDVYGITGYDAYYGFLSGICAGNYDVTDILVDSTFKICPEGVAGIEDFVKKLHELSETAETNIVLLISADDSELPATINAVCEKI
mgnify:CR=1 FL=1